ncbi:hypothetical protein OAX78_01550 [Planctomycetota bacterium]|nr:hypothetical protein [Planctomycetota bacterium]
MSRKKDWEDLRAVKKPTNLSYYLCAYPQAWRFVCDEELTKAAHQGPPDAPWKTAWAASLLLGEADVGTFLPTEDWPRLHWPCTGPVGGRIANVVRQLDSLLVGSAPAEVLRALTAARSTLVGAEEGAPRVPLLVEFGEHREPPWYAPGAVLNARLAPSSKLPLSVDRGGRELDPSDPWWEAANRARALTIDGAHRSLSIPTDPLRLEARGHSFGLALLAAFALADQGATLPAGVALSGELAPDGSLRPSLGGVPAKARAAVRAGVRLMILPAQTRTPVPEELCKQLVVETVPLDLRGSQLREHVLGLLRDHFLSRLMPPPRDLQIPALLPCTVLGDPPAAPPLEFGTTPGLERGPFTCVLLGRSSPLDTLRWTERALYLALERPPLNMLSRWWVPAAVGDLRLADFATGNPDSVTRQLERFGGVPPALRLGLVAEISAGTTPRELAEWEQSLRSQAELGSNLAVVMWTREHPAIRPLTTLLSQSTRTVVLESRGLSEAREKRSHSDSPLERWLIATGVSAAELEGLADLNALIDDDAWDAVHEDTRSNLSARRALEAVSARLEGKPRSAVDQALITLTADRLPHQAASLLAAYAQQLPERIHSVFENEAVLASDWLVDAWLANFSGDPVASGAGLHLRGREALTLGLLRRASQGSIIPGELATHLAGLGKGRSRALGEVVALFRGNTTPTLTAGALRRLGSATVQLAIRAGARVDASPRPYDETGYWWGLATRRLRLDELKRLAALPADQRAVFGLCSDAERAAFDRATCSWTEEVQRWWRRHDSPGSAT